MNRKLPEEAAFFLPCMQKNPRLEREPAHLIGRKSNAEPGALLVTLRFEGRLGKFLASTGARFQKCANLKSENQYLLTRLDSLKRTFCLTGEACSFAFEKRLSRNTASVASGVLIVSIYYRHLNGTRKCVVVMKGGSSRGGLSRARVPREHAGGENP